MPILIGKTSENLEYPNLTVSSLCPLNASFPITGSASIPVSSSDVSGIPSIALVIPDFEGTLTLRMFSNSSQTQIGCFQAAMRNGATFSHPAAVGSVLGIFTFVAVLASFATTIYGVSVPEIRTHYAHSLSVLVVFEVFQSIFFSGALSLDWPSVLPAFWSNFAWSAGMIYTPSVIKSINSLTGINGNSSQVGGAGSTIINNNGGLQQQIYGRSLGERSSYHPKGEVLAHRIFNRATVEAKNAAQDPRLYSWAGLPVQAGLPAPGNWSNFAGELSLLEIPAADAFMTGLLWFLVLVACMIGAAAIFKWSLEGFSHMKWMKQERLDMFRKNWITYIGLIVLRTCFIAFFMMMTLTFYQFSYGGKAGPIAIAVIVFLIFFVGVLGACFYACFYRVKFGRYESQPKRLHFQRTKVLKVLPWYRAARESSLDDDAKSKSAGSVGIFNVKFVDHEAEGQSIHANADYTTRFGWLSARYRRTRWWFFAFWVVYQIVRACFIGGARANPEAQVIGLFIWELIAFIVIIMINPYEGARNTALAVYMLGIGKVATAGLSIAFLSKLNVARIPTTVVGVIIIVIQGLLVIGVLILIVLGAISSYMSMMRNREEFKPKRLENIKMKYVAHLSAKEKDVPPPPPPAPEEPKEPYFAVKTVRRAPKIEDEDDQVPDMENMNAAASQFSLGGNPINRPSRANSMAGSMRSMNSGYGNVPYGARVHRASWSSRDFQMYQQNEVARGESPFNTPSRSASVSGYNHSSGSTAPLVKPSASHSTLRSNTPTREQRQQFATQRFGNAD